MIAVFVVVVVVVVDDEFAVVVAVLALSLAVLIGPRKIHAISSCEVGSLSAYVFVVRGNRGESPNPLSEILEKIETSGFLLSSASFGSFGDVLAERVEEPDESSRDENDR